MQRRFWPEGQAHHLLQQLNDAARYRKQAIFWFDHLARERQAQTTITQIHTSTEPLDTVTLDSFESTQRAAQASKTYYSASTPQGVTSDLSRRPGCAPCSSTAAARRGSISLEDLTQALSSLPRGKTPGCNGLYHTTSTSTFGGSWGQSSLLCSRRPTSQMLSLDMTEGCITLL